MSKKISEMLVEIAENEQRVYDAGERKGYEEGYADGSKGGGGGGNYDEGYKVGYDRGHKEGYDEGFTEGEDAGYEDGKTDGYADGYAEGHEAGEDSGYATGKADGLTEGVATGKAEGIEIGRAEGYVTGKEEGIEIGKQAEYDAFWDGVTNSGNRTDYVSAFRQWGNEYIRPNIKITPTAVDSKNQTFCECKNLKKIEAQYFDFSQTPIGTRANQSYYYTFSSCDKLEEIEDIGMQADFAYTYSFAYCGKLRTIAKIRAKEETVFNNAFRGDYWLENVTFDGVIGQNIEFQWSTKLSADSIRNIMEHLSGTASGKTLTLSKTAVEASTTNGEYYFGAYAGGGCAFTTNPITVYPGQTIKVTWEVEDGHSFNDNTNSWWFGFCDESIYPGRPNGWTYTATEGTEELSLMFYFSPGTEELALDKRVKIKVVKIDSDTGEEYSDNLVTSLTGDSSAWAETMFDFWSRLRRNWTISTQ